MRTLIALAVLPMLFDVTPGSAVSKLKEKKNCTFTIEQRVEGEIGGAGRQLEARMNGVWVKPDVLHVKFGDRAEMARRGTNALFKEGDQWKTAAEHEKDRQSQQQQGGQQGGQQQQQSRAAQIVLDRLAAVLAPADEIARRGGGLAKQKTTEKVNGTDCTVFMGPLSKDAANAFAKECCEVIPAANGGGGGGGRMPGGGGPRAPGPGGGGGGGGGSFTPATPKEASGGAKLLISTTDELPMQLVLLVTFKIEVRTDNGGSEQREVSVTRTLTLADFEKAKLELDEYPRKKLGIVEKP